MRKQTPLVIDAMTIWNMRKPQYDGHVIGTGAHGSKKYRRQSKSDLRRAIAKGQL